MNSCFGCGDRRTVLGREGLVFAGLEFGGFLDVPHRVSIKKSASYGFQWNQFGNCGGSAHPRQMVRKERQKRPKVALSGGRRSAKSGHSDVTTNLGAI